jgi:S1-C subfamily serine protease
LEENRARSLIACPREVGADCPHCEIEITLGDPIMVCQACGTVHHRACWRDHGRCGSYSCTPARRPSLARENTLPVMTITKLDLDHAVPLPTATPRLQFAATSDVSVAAKPRRPPQGVNRLAIASLVCALVGIPLFGIITGLVAVLLGVLALSSIRATSQRGLTLALSGVLLGIVDVTGWIIFLGIMLFRPAPDLHFSELQPDMAVINNLEPALKRAMRANVLIERGVGLAALGGKAIGSGVILQIAHGEALLVTNRHVVDPDYPSSGAPASDAGYLAGLGRLQVKLLGPAQAEGTVVWLAPHQIDLALVRFTCPKESQAQETAWQPGRPLIVGSSVFAIGNPHNLGWSHTQGVISQLRTQAFDSRPIRIIQTQASINPGNSGGGLYDQSGYLLGINTWTADKSTSEGIGFALALENLIELAPPQLVLKMESTDTNPQEGP